MASAEELHRDCPLAATLARRLREARAELTGRWLERIVRRVTLDANHVFPTDELLDHVPLLIDGIAEFMEHPEASVTGASEVVMKARELGALRHAQGFDEYEILKEYEIFGGILFAFLTRTVDTIDEPCTRSELLGCAQRLFLAVTVIQEATATHYLQLMRAQISEREERLHRFNRALTHELKNQLGAATGALEMLALDPPPAAQQARMVEIAARNLQAIRRSLDNLVELSRLDPQPRQQRHVLLPASATEVARQLRETARAAGVEIEIGALPAVEVAAAGVELALGNLVSNAIKYADPGKPRRWVRVSGALHEDAMTREVIVEVRDNGLGIPADRRDRIFEPYYRAHTDLVAVEGTGLGLALVRDTLIELGGRVWAEHPDEGVVIKFTLPARRATEGTPALTR